MSRPLAYNARHEHDPWVSRKFALDRHGGADRLRVDRCAERDRDQPLEPTERRPSVRPVHARKRRPKLPRPPNQAGQGHRLPIAGLPERIENVREVPAALHRSATGNTGGRPAGMAGVREVRARKRRPELPRPRSERHPVPSRQPHPPIASLPARTERVQEIHRRWLVADAAGQGASEAEARHARLSACAPAPSEPRLDCRRRSKRQVEMGRDYADLFEPPSPME